MTPVDVTAEVIALERAALDRWGAGDPTGYVELFADDITYFDPVQERRIDGRRAMVALMDSIAGKIRVDRYDMQRPVVQRLGDVALLYRRTPEGWRIVHSHWSYIKPATSSGGTDPEAATG
jgi:ketosteroid isomerase-like protein